MPLYLPKLRQDLVMRPHQTARDTSVIVKNPVTGRFFQFGEAELFIAQQLDGKTTLETVHQRTESHFNAELSLETLSAFLANLKKNGMLESPASAQQTPNSKQSRFRGSALYCRFKVFDPCELLKRMVPWTGFFYTPFFVVFSALTIATAVGITVGHWGDYRESLPRLYGVSQIALVIALNFLVVTAHEFGHGLTCAHFGGEVHEMGCALVFLQPAFYCNVSDAWLFPKKSQRLWVGFAGPYFELFLWSLAVLTWRVTEPDVWINFVALSVMTTSGVKTLFNFNPLIKLDGYYLLSDYLELPNMRRRSFRYVGSFFERLFGFGKPAASNENLTLRERFIFAVYGSTALAGSFSILGLILISAGGVLIEGRSPTAVLVTLGLLGMKYRRRFRRMFGNAQGGSASFDDEDFDSYERTDVAAESAALIAEANVIRAEETAIAERPPSQDRAAPTYDPVPEEFPQPDQPKGSEPFTEPENAPSPQPSEKKKRVRWGRLVKRVVWIGIAVAGIFALFYGHGELRVPGPFNVLPIENCDVRASVDGVVGKIYVREGDRVRAGQPIAQLVDIDTLAALDKTEEQINQTNATLKKLVVGPTQAEIEVAKAAVTKAKDALKYAQIRLKMMKQGLDEKLVSQKEYEDAAALESAARNDLLTSESQLRVLLEGSRPEDIEATKAQVDQLQTDRGHLQKQRRLLTVYSPSAGIVATPTPQLKQLVNQFVKKGDLIAKVFDLRTVTAEIAVDEKDVADVKENQRVVLRARAFPDEEFYGKVNFVSISMLGNTSGNGSEPSLLPVAPPSSSSNAKHTIIVTTQIENPALLLKPEMTGQAKILCGRRRALDLVTRRIAHAIKVEFWSWW
jgi:putative peptide zinc metalloprotease protein